MLLPFGKKSKSSAVERLPRVLRSLELLINEERMSDIDRIQDLDEAYDFIFDALCWSKILAARRKIDPDIAAIASVLQNVGKIVTGQHENHAESGYELAKQLLLSLNCFEPEEIKAIATSVRNHSRREITQGPLNEIVKDTAIYVRYLQGQQLSNPQDIVRLNGIRLELATRVR